MVLFLSEFLGFLIFGENKLWRQPGHSWQGLFFFFQKNTSPFNKTRILLFWGILFFKIETFCVNCRWQLLNLGPVLHNKLISFEIPWIPSQHSRTTTQFLSMNGDLPCESSNRWFDVEACLSLLRGAPRIQAIWDSAEVYTSCSAALAKRMHSMSAASLAY